MDQRIVLAPNCSLTPTTANWFYLSICAFSLPVSLLFAWAGFWPVLVFWVLEMVAIGIALQSGLQRRNHTQTLVISDARVELVTRSRHGIEKQEFARHWARVRLRTPRGSHRPSRLTIESHGRAGVVGSFLTDEERARLAVRLHAMVGGPNASPSLEHDFTEGT